MGRLWQIAMLNEISVTRVFVEYHPLSQYGKKEVETETYYKERRKIFDENDYQGYPLIAIDSLKNIEFKVAKIRELLAFELNKRK